MGQMEDAALPVMRVNVAKQPGRVADVVVRPSVEVAAAADTGVAVADA